MDDKARGRICLQCSSKVADALRQGILIRGWSVRAESEEPMDHDEVPCRWRGCAKEARGSAERGGEGKGKDKGYGHGIQSCGCASTHPWSQCKLVKYYTRKDHRCKCVDRGRMLVLCEATTANDEWYVSQYG